MRKPDFIVAGAPKCGTTALHAFLRAQNDVFVPEAKEPHFFSSDITTRKRLSEAEYLALFEDAGDARRVGEVSVWYLYSERSARAIRELCGPIQIVLLLRNPIDAMHSLHSQLVWNGDEDILDFEQALLAEPDRLNGHRQVEGAWLGSECLCYRRVYRYPEQVERYFQTFGREHVHCVLFDDLVSDPEAAFNGVLDFLGLPPAGFVDPGRVNPNKALRRPWLRDLHRRLNRPLRHLARRLIRDPRRRRRIGRRLVDGWKGLYTRTEERPPLTPELRRRLSHELEDEVAGLEALLGRDLGSWLER